MTKAKISIQVIDALSVCVAEPTTPSTTWPYLNAGALIMVHNGNILGAIKEVRNDSGCTLMEAKSAVDTYIRKTKLD